MEIVITSIALVLAGVGIGGGTIMIPVLRLGYGLDAFMATATSLFAIILLQGVVMPAGSVFGAMLHGNTEWLTGGLVYKYGTLMEIVLALIIGFIGVPVGNLIFALL